MATTWFMVIRYLVTSEESRIERMDRWNSVFLIDCKPFHRAFLEISKGLVLLILSVGIGMALAVCCQ